METMVEHYSVFCNRSRNEFIPEGWNSAGIGEKRDLYKDEENITPTDIIRSLDEKTIYYKKAEEGVLTELEMNDLWPNPIGKHNE